MKVTSKTLLIFVFVLLTGCNQTIEQSVIKLEQSIDTAGQYLSETIAAGRVWWSGYEDPLTNVILGRLKQQDSSTRLATKTAVISDVTTFRRSYILVQKYQTMRAMESELVTLYRGRASAGLLSPDITANMREAYESTSRQLRSEEETLNEAIKDLSVYLGDEGSSVQDVLFPYDGVQPSLPDIEILLTRTKIKQLENVPNVAAAFKEATDLDEYFAARVETVWPDRNLLEHYNIQISDTGALSIPENKPEGLDFPLEKLTAGSELLASVSQAYKSRVDEAEAVLFFAIKDYVSSVNTYNNSIKNASDLELSLNTVREDYQRGLTDKASLLEAELKVLRLQTQFAEAQAGAIFSYAEVLKALGPLEAL